MSRVHKAKPILMNQTFPEISLRKSHRKRRDRVLSNKPNHPQLRVHPLTNSRLAIHRTADRSPSHLAAASRPETSSNGDPHSPAVAATGVPARSDPRPPLRVRSAASRTYGSDSRTPPRRRLRSLRRLRGQGEGGSARGGAPASGGGAKERRGGSRRKDRKRRTEG